MLRSVSKLLLTALICLGVTACGKSENKDDGVADTIERTVEQFSLNDQWQGACRNERFDVFGIASSSERYDFGTSVTRVTTLFAADNCAEPAVEVRESGTYTLSDEVSADARALDIRYESAFLKPLTPNAANALNAIYACGNSRWSAGREVDVTAQTGDPVTSRCWTKTPREVFDVAKISSSSLLLGLQEDPNDKTSPETRPSAVDEGYLFTRQ